MSRVARPRDRVCNRACSSSATGRWAARPGEDEMEVRHRPERKPDVPQRRHSHERAPPSTSPARLAVPGSPPASSAFSVAPWYEQARRREALRAGCAAWSSPPPVARGAARLAAGAGDTGHVTCGQTERSTGRSPGPARVPPAFDAGGLFSGRPAQCGGEPRHEAVHVLRGVEHALQAVRRVPLLRRAAAPAPHVGLHGVARQP